MVERPTTRMRSTASVPACEVIGLEKLKETAPIPVRCPRNITHLRMAGIEVPHVDHSLDGRRRESCRRKSKWEAIHITDVK